MTRVTANDSTGQGILLFGKCDRFVKISSLIFRDGGPG